MGRFAAVVLVVAVGAAMSSASVTAATGWTLTPSPNTSLPQGGFAGVACPTTTECIAVGSHPNTTNGGPTPLAEVWNGTAWSLLAAALPVVA